ncbi:MAG: helix-turn-helix transcriptional regulator [Phycisphaeraceae bacterium]|nr:helix-turn-helix transcriptional regulator [Phycisphaeraceae bacterium]
MTLTPCSNAVSPIAPAGLDLTGLVQELQRLMSVRAVMIGLLGPGGVRRDECLASWGVPVDALTAWCEGRHVQDRLFEQARQRGMASGPASSCAVNGNWSVGAMVNMVVLPEPLPQRRSWWGIAIGGDEPLMHRHQHVLGLLLRGAQCRYDTPSEPRMGRLILGWDHRVIHVDPYLALRFHNEPSFRESILSIMREIVPQRWPDLEDNGSHDLAVTVGGERTWICFRRESVTSMPHARRWCVEIRPLPDDDLPTPGLIEDVRIARALAYIHDHFHQAPPLSRIAQAAHVSSFHFHRLFTRQVGASPKQYLQRRQLQMAKWMLWHTRASVGYISSATGFSSHGHFTSTFHRLVGVSPSEYREQAGMLWLSASHSGAPAAETDVPMHMDPSGQTD